MTDLDNTQIINADESLLENASTIETEATLKIINGADPTTHHIGKETIIGRSNPSTLVIAAPSLSKQHAKINLNNGQYFITDLGSSNKTFHNKIQLQPHVCYALHDGDEIKLGDLVCSFEEQKSTAKDAHTLSEPSDQTYVPVVNTLVEDDSPWHDDEADDDVSVPPIIEETKVDAIPSTQTITDSYDDQEPTQPMKIWNGNSNHANRLSRASVKSSDDVTSKTNGGNEPSTNGSSSFMSSAKHADDDHDDGSLVIGSSTLPATVPLLIESTQINDDDQLEIVTSVHTKETVEEKDEKVTFENTTTTITTTVIETDIQNTQAYTLEPAGEVTAADNQIADTQAYELESETLITDITETKREEVHKVVIDGDTMIEQITTTTTTTTAIIETENAPMATLAYDLQPANEPMHLETTAAPSAVYADTQAYDLDDQIESSSSDVVDAAPVSSKPAESINAEEDLSDRAPTTTKERVEITITRDSPQETLPNEDMETESSNPRTSTKNEQPANVEQGEPIITTIVEEDVSSTSKEKHRARAKNEEEMLVDESEKPTAQPTPAERETTPELDQSADISSNELESKINDTSIPAGPDETATSTLDAEEAQPEDEEEEEEKEAAGAVSGRGQRGMARRNARRARGRRGGAAARARVVSTRIYGGRRNAVPLPTVSKDENNTTLEETIQTETEESPKKASSAPVEEEPKANDTQPLPEAPEASTKAATTPSLNTSGSNVRVSARIKARASSGRNRQFPYTDDYVDLDDLEKQSKTSTAAATSAAAATTTPTAAASSAATTRKSTRGGRATATPQKRISLRQQPIDASASPEEKSGKSKDQVDVYEDMDTGGENEEPDLSTSRTAAGRKRKSTTPVATASTTKRTRSTTPQTAPTNSTRRKPTSEPDPLSVSNTTTPKRARKSTKLSTPTEASPSKAATSVDRPVRIALSSHLNFESQHLEVLRKLGFEIMDESCHVDALVVDRIRRTKKFFMCLARGAHILSPSWIEAMIKENRYIPYDEYYLQDTSAETRYGFQLRDSVRLAKEHPVFQGRTIFCTKDTSPPYDDLKDIVEAAGGKFVEKINRSKPCKELICIVAQNHKMEYEDLFKKGVPILSEEFALSGISKQKLDFESFSLFQSAAATAKTAGTK